MRGQCQIERQYPGFVFRPEFRVLGQIGLHDAQFYARDRLQSCPRQTQGAKSANPGEGQDSGGDCRRQPVSCSLHRGFFAENRGSRKNKNGDDGQTIKADDRGQLRGQKIAAKRHAECVPGKSGQDMPAQPFRETQSGGKRKNPPRAWHPHQPRQHEADSRKNRERGGEPGNAQRQGPGEFVRLDKKRRAKPPESRQEITKAPPPAGAKCAPGRDRQAQKYPPAGWLLPRLRATVDEPDGDGHRDCERGEKS